MSAIGLDGFEDRFAADDDPWRTFSDADEALKRRAILHALGPARRGRVLELASGNGSNSRALADRSLRLEATEGAPAGVRLTARALDGKPRGEALRLALPARFPHDRYQAIVVAELLYYLTPRDMAAVAREVARTLSPGGRLVLAHHRIDFHDFAQHADHIHTRFLAGSAQAWRRSGGARRTGRWIVEAFEPRLARGAGDASTAR